MQYRFVGRRAELERLESIYSRPGLSTCAVYGRRQVGKTALLTEFSRGKRAIYLQFSRRSYYENLVRMRHDLEDITGESVPDTDSFAELMLIIRDFCDRERTLVVFDEFPYLVECAPWVPSIIQRFIDLDVRGTDGMVVICGSSVAMMRDAVESIGSPLYGRFDERMEVREMGYRECAEFHPGMSDWDVLRTYMTVGGMPRYHLMMDGDTYEECLARNFIGPTAPLLDEGDRLISEDSNAMVYSAVVACISDGMTRQSDICSKLNMDKGECSRRLREMEGLGIVSRVHPMAGAPKRPIYRIQDNLLAFWYDVVRRYRTVLGSVTMDDGDKALMVRDRVNTFLGRRFELLCEEYLETSYSVSEIGRWWGDVDGSDGDVDIVANVIGRGLTSSQLMVECKFTHRKAGIGVLDDLVRTVGCVGTCHNVRYMVISASGFEHGLEERAEGGPVVLVDMDGLMGRTPPQDLDGIPVAGTEMIGRPSLLHAVHEPLVDPVGLLRGEEHGGDLHERVLGALDDLDVVEGVQAPSLGGLLQAELDVVVVRHQDDGLELLQAQFHGGHYPVVAIHQEVAVPPLDDDERLVQAPLELVLAADELVHVDLLLGGDDPVYLDVPVHDLEPQAVLLLQEVLDGHDLPGTGLLDLGPHDVDVGYDAHELLVLVHHGQVPEAVPEEDAGGVVYGHGRDGAEGPPLHDGADLRVGLVDVTEELLRRDEAEQVALLDYREPVEVGGDDLLPHLLHRHVGTHRLDVPDHVLSDRCLWHRTPN